MDNTIFLQNVLRLISEKNITKNKMLVDLGMSRSTFVDWKKKGHLPNGDTLKKIAEYFNVSVDFLLGNEQKEKLPTVDGVELTEYELEVIKAFRAASPDAKKEFLRSRGIPFDESKL